MIDLHAHSTFSDGSESPERVIELAAEVGCSTVALTDHDGLDGLGRAKLRAEELGIGFIPGCEVSCAFSPGSMHLLCYFVEAGSGPLQDELERLRSDRSARNAEMIDRLSSLGVPITAAEVQAEAGGAIIGRPHFAALLVQKGFASSISEAFERYLAKGAAGYVDKTRVTPTTIVEQARASGAVVSLAHPLTLGVERDELKAIVAELADAGLVGLECYYASYDTQTREELAAIARSCRLVPTGGSDFHGSYKQGLQLGVGRGDLFVPDELVDELEAARP